MKKFVFKILSFFTLFILINILNISITNINADLTDEGWSEDIRVTYYNTHSFSPQIAVYENNVHVVWEDDRDGKDEIYYKCSTDNGTNWGSPIKLNGNYGDFHSDPSIVVYENNLHVVWMTMENGNWETYYKRSLDNGISWQPEIMINDDDIDSWKPKIAIEGNNLCIIWGDQKDGNWAFEVYFTKSNDNGANWSPNIRLSSNDGLDSDPNDIIISNDKIYIVWEDSKDTNSREIYFRNSNDFGNNWASQKRITNQDGVDSKLASIAVFNNNVHVVWEDQWDMNWEIGYTRSLDNGINWGNNYYLSEDDGVYSQKSDIVANNNNIYVIWGGGGSGFSEIYYKTSQDNGDNWNSEIILSDNDGKISRGPRMTNRQDSIYVTWEDYRNNYYEIYFKLKGNAPPKLMQYIVEPSYGDIFTNFNYSVIYSDIENDSPLFVYVNIDGLNYTMNETDKNDLIFSDGKEYYYSTTLHKSESHTYCFYTSDGHYDIKTELFYGPLVDVGQPAYIEIQPSFKTITTDDYVKFSANVFDADGNLLNYLPKWNSTGGGIIDQTGNFTATTPGNWTIFANLSEISGKAIVNITLGKLNKIIISPDFAEITTDDYIQFNAIGSDSNGNIIEIDPVWDVSGGGNIDEEGNFTATTPGTFFVYANDSGISSIGTIKIVIGNLSNIEVTPSQVSITTDDNVQFSSIGYDSYGNIIEISPTWETTGGGIINETGYFNATTPGSWIIYANISGVSGNAVLNITIGKLANLELSPPFSNVNVRDNIQFSAIGYDADGNLINITPNWKASGGGSIDQTGNYSAQEAGNWTVTATHNGVSTSTNVTVNPPDEESDGDGKDQNDVNNNSLIFIAVGVITIIVLIGVALFFKKIKGKNKSDSSKGSERKKVKPK